MENRLQALYWTELVQLKVSCEYIRRYRDFLAIWITRFAMVRAFVSLGALGTWAAVKSYPMLWGGIIAAAQVVDALQNAVPFGVRLRGTSALCVALEALFIDGQMEWEDIFAGRIDEDSINSRRHKLMKLRHEADAKNLPTGLPVRKRLFELAEMDAKAYFISTYQTGSIE